MSQQSAREAEKTLENLKKAKTVSNQVISNIRVADRNASRLLTTVAQLGRGDVAGIVSYLGPTVLAKLGPYGAILALGAIVGASIYEQFTKERPSEVYNWRYPK